MYTQKYCVKPYRAQYKTVGTHRLNIGFIIMKETEHLKNVIFEFLSHFGQSVKAHSIAI